MRKVLILGLFGRFWVAFWVIRPYVFQVCFSAAAPGPLDLSQISLKLYQTEELKYRAGGGCSYTNRVKKLYVFPVWGRYVHGFLAQVILFTLEPIRIFPSSLSFHYLFTRGPRFGQANATGEDRPQKMNVHDFQWSPSVD